MIWLILVSLGMLAAGFFLAPLFFGNRSGEVLAADATDTLRDTINLELYQQRLNELEADDSIDPAELQILKNELQKSLLADVREEGTGPELVSGQQQQAVKMLVVTALLVPVMAIFIYADWGLSLGASSDLAVTKDLESFSHGQMDKEKLQATLVNLANMLEDQPDNHDGWYLYGQYSLVLGRYHEASEAFQRLTLVYEQDSSLAALYAETLYLAEGRQFTGKVRAAIDHALALNPHDLNMLEIRGMNAWMAGDGAGALEFFARALKSNPDESRAERLRQVIRQIETSLGIQSTEAEIFLLVDVELAEGLVVPADRTVFVYARALEGSPMPLAITRFRAADLPRQVRLSESMSMMPQLSLATHEQVELVARISEKGLADPGPDDYEIRSGPINVRKQTEPVRLVIRHKVNDFVRLKE